MNVTAVSSVDVDSIVVDDIAQHDDRSTSTLFA
jgi:hypothetical protein